MKLKNCLQYIFFVTNFLLPLCIAQATKEYTSYRRYPVCKPSENIRYPKSISDIVSIVKYAISRGLTVKAFGSRHSQTDIICTDGIPVNMSAICTKKMNNDSTATFGAGLQLRDATSFLRLHDRGLQNLPCFGNITLGGAIGTGAHGSTIKYQNSISAQVASVKIVDGMGNIKTISDPEELKAFRIHLGLLGIIVEVTLNTVELYKTRAKTYAVRDEILTNGTATYLAKNSDQVSLYWFPAFHEVVVAEWWIVDKETPGNDTTNYFAPSIYSNFALLISIAKEVAFSLTESKCATANTLGYSILHVFEYYLELSLLYPVPDWIPIFATQDGKFKNPSVGYYDEMFTTVCHETPQGDAGKACSWSHDPYSVLLLDNEFNIPLYLLAAFVETVRSIVAQFPTAFPLLGIHIRFSGASDIYMSTAHERDSANVEFFSWKRDDLYNRAMGSSAGYQTLLQTLAKHFNGRSHWGKSGLAYHSSEMLDKKLNETARQNFIGVMQKYDPNGVFINSFGRRLTRNGTKIDIDPLTKHCAILDNCFCSKNSDCAPNQICSTIYGYNVTVCKIENEVSPVPFNKSIFPPPYDFVSFLITQVPTMVDSVISNCTLSDGVGTIDLLLSGLLPVEKVLAFAGTLAEKLGKIRSVKGAIGALGDLVNAVVPVGTNILG